MQQSSDQQYKIDILISLQKYIYLNGNNTGCPRIIYLSIHGKPFHAWYNSNERLESLNIWYFFVHNENQRLFFYNTQCTKILDDMQILQDIFLIGLF